MEYISKSALVAEIEKRRKLVSDPILSGDDLMIGERNALFDLLSFIDTLEVKEVDLQEEPAGLDKGKLMDMLEESLSKETKDRWNERLDEDGKQSK